MKWKWIFGKMRKKNESLKKNSIFAIILLLIILASDLFNHAYYENWPLYASIAGKFNWTVNMYKNINLKKKKNYYSNSCNMLIPWFEPYSWQYAIIKICCYCVPWVFEYYIIIYIYMYVHCWKSLKELCGIRVSLKHNITLKLTSSGQTMHSSIF